MHPSGECGSPRFHEQVIVIPHEAVGVKNPGLFADDVGDQVQKVAAIGAVAKNRPALVPTTREVVERAWKLHAERSRHMHSLLSVVMWQVEA
jgi:hypothetical protein